MGYKKYSYTRQIWDIIKGKLGGVSEGKAEVGLEVKRCDECLAFRRPCLADGKPAVFHRWVDEEAALLRINAFTRQGEAEEVVRHFRETQVVPNFCTTEKLRQTAALVEYPDGSVGRVKVELVQFLDRKTP